MPTLILVMKPQFFNVGLVHNRYRKDFENVTEKYRRVCLVCSCRTCHQTGIQNSLNGQTCILRILVVFILLTLMIMRVCRSLNWNSVTNILFHGLTALLSLSILAVEVTRSHSDTPHSTGLLWTRDHPGTGTLTWQHTTLAPDKQPCSRRIRTRNSSKRAVAGSQFSSHAHRHRLSETLGSRF